MSDGKIMDYCYIRAWERLMGGFPYYIEMQLAKARKEHAPQTAIFRRDDGTWALVQEIRFEDIQVRVQQLADDIRANHEPFYRG